MITLAQFVLATAAGSLLAAAIFWIRDGAGGLEGLSLGQAVYRTLLTPQGWVRVFGLMTLATLVVATFVPSRYTLWDRLAIAFGDQPPLTSWEQWHDWPWFSFFFMYLGLTFVCGAIAIPEVVSRAWRAARSNNHRSSHSASGARSDSSIGTALVVAFIGSVLADVWSNRGRR